MNRRRASAIVVAVVAPLLLVAALVALRSNDTTPRKLPVASGETERSASFAADAGQSSSAFGGVRYEAGPGLPTLTGVARAYRVTSDVDADAARRVARSLGVEGEPHEADGSFTFASPDGGALYVSPVGGGSFSYSSAAPGDLTVTDSNVSSSGGAGDEPNGVQRIFGCVAPAEPTTTGPRTPPSGGCTPQPSTTPPYPETFLSEADAKAKALDVLTAAGVATEGAEVEAHEDGYLGTWQISVSRVVDGMTADGLQSSVTFDAAGIRFAYGSLGQVEPFDEYPLIGTTASIAHLNDGTDPLFRHRGLETSGGEVRCSADGTCSSEAAGSSVCPANATCDLGEAEAPPASAPPTTFACPADGSGCSVPPVAPTPSCAPAADALCPSLPCDLAPGGSCEQICKTTGNPGDPSTQGCWFAYSPCPTVTTVPDGGDATLLCLLPDLPCGKPTSDAPPYPCPPPDACGFYPSTPTTCLPSPPATSVPLEPQVVTLTEATLGLMLVPSGASDAYLVPVYRFTAADGFGPVALAIDAAWLDAAAAGLGRPVSSDERRGDAGSFRWVLERDRRRRRRAVLDARRGRSLLHRPARDAGGSGPGSAHDLRSTRGQGRRPDRGSGCRAGRGRLPDQLSGCAWKRTHALAARRRDRAAPGRALGAAVTGIRRFWHRERRHPRSEGVNRRIPSLAVQCGRGAAGLAVTPRAARPAGAAGRSAEGDLYSRPSHVRSPL